MELFGISFILFFIMFSMSFLSYASDSSCYEKAAKALKIKTNDIQSLHIVKRSIDARKKAVGKSLVQNESKLCSWKPIPLSVISIEKAVTYCLSPLILIYKRQPGSSV